MRLVLGCGNPDRGDDAAGRLVARRLGELGIEARENSGDALALLDAWQGADEVVVTVGGTIPADDIPELKKLGVAEVFTPGAPTDEIVEFVKRAVAGREGASA